MSDDPFTSVRWDRREDADAGLATTEMPSFDASSPENPAPSDPIMPHLQADFAPALQDPATPTAPAIHTHGGESEPPHVPIEEDAVKNSDLSDVSAVPSAQDHEEGASDSQNTQNLTENDLAENADAGESPEVSKNTQIRAAPPDNQADGVEETPSSPGPTSSPAHEHTEANASAGADQRPSQEEARKEVHQEDLQKQLQKEELQKEELQKQLQKEELQKEAFSKMAHKFAQYNIDSHVSDPLSDRDGNSKAFISYLVVTKTNHPDVLKLQAQAPASGSATLKVRRRYGDFRFLHDCLMADFPQLLVPPLPAKSNFKYLTGDTFSTPFVHKRLHSLDRFISYICQHKLLSQSSVFHYFISDSTEWGTFTHNLKILRDEDESSLVGKVVNEELLAETVMNFFTSSKHKRETNKDILEISDKLKKLYENLVKLDRIFSKLNKKNSDLKSDYEAFSVQINKLAALNDAAKEPASEEHSVSKVTANFRLFSESLVYFSDNWAQLYKHVDESFLVTLKDCSKYIVRLTNLIELQHNKKIDLQVLQDYLGKARTDLANLSGGPSHTQHSAPNPALIGQYSGGIVNNTAQLIKDTISTSATPHIGSSQAENKKWKLQNRISQLEAEIAAQTSLVNDLTSRIINEEYPNWDEFNKAQLKQAMAQLCDQKISFYQGMMNNWTDVEAKLMKRLEELES